MDETAEEELESPTLHAWLPLVLSLVGATRLAIKGIPTFRPNMAYANRIFDHLDSEMLVGEYNLPKRSPRKCLKREENLITMCCMQAVSNVFMFKQARARPRPRAPAPPPTREHRRGRPRSTGGPAGSARTGCRSPSAGACSTT